MKRLTALRSTPARRRSAIAALAAGALTLLVSCLALALMGSAQAAAVSVPLGTAGGYAVLAGSTVTNTGPSVITGDLGLSPGTSVTGFPPGTVNGTIHPADAAALQAQSDLTIAYNAAAAELPPLPITADLGGQTLTAGVYNSASSIGLTGALTLDGQGNPDSVWVFQAGSTLTTASGSSVNLINGASACNVYWQVGSSATLGTGSSFQGSILALQSITLTTNVTLQGRALARNGAVTLDSDTIAVPNCAVAPPTSAPPTVSSTPTISATPTTAPTTSATGAPTVSPTSGPSPTTPAQITPIPTGPAATGDGGSIHGSHLLLGMTGIAALLASMGAFFLWRREHRKA